MPTGACGIACDVCGLRLLDICSSCGSGLSIEAQKKIDAQNRIFGMPCLILECAHNNRVEYCMRDCSQFPCHLFRKGPYPFSEGFIQMQERRRKDGPISKGPSGDRVKVPDQYWEDLKKKNVKVLRGNAGARPFPPEGLIVPFIGEAILVDLDSRCLKQVKNGEWEKIDYPLMELICLVYLLNVGPEPLSNQMISVKELKDAHFFQGPHELRLKPLLERYGTDLQGFKKSAESLGGEAQDLADAAYKIPALPKVPLYYLFWEGSDEFEPRFSVLFDRTVERHLPADAIWGLVNLVTDALLRAQMGKESDDTKRVSH
ncbi:MAG: DUF3786 domain-containing protein [Pseudomonadota bacterium]